MKIAIMFDDTKILIIDNIHVIYTLGSIQRHCGIMFLKFV